MGSKDPIKTAKIKLPGEGTAWVPISKFQTKHIAEDDLGPSLLIIVDEIAELLGDTGGSSEEAKREKALKAEIEEIIQSITQLGRAASVHCVLAPLGISTLVPTTEGIKKIKDIEIGDFVFDQNGWSTKVIGLSPIQMSEQLFSITLKNIKTNRLQTLKADNKHYFPVIQKNNEKLEKLNMVEIFNKFSDGEEMFIPGLDLEPTFQIENVEVIENELVRCIKIDSPDEIFLILGDPEK